MRPEDQADAQADLGLQRSGSGRDPQVVPEHRAFVFGTEPAAALQLRHQEIDDVEQVARGGLRVRDQVRI